MLKAILSYLAGSYIFTVPEESRLELVNCLRDEGISVRRVHLTPDGEYSFTVPAVGCRRLKGTLDELGINYALSNLKGFPRHLLFLVRRPGLIIGGVLILLMSMLSSRVIWGFDVVGNTTVPDDEILLMLDELGCGVGDYIPSLDLDLIHAKFLAKNHDISWIAVNLKGNFATVEVIETRKAESPVFEEGVYANIVAKEDAQIYLVKTEAGVSVAEPGRVVKKGEILISGVIDVREDRVRYEYANGEVLAYVPRVIDIKVPISSAEKVYTGREKSEKSIKFFKKSINLFSKGGIEYTVYDKIIEDRQICLFGKYPLPLWTSAVTYREYEYVTREHTIGETVASAMAELRDRLDETLEDAELISNKVTYTVTDDAFVIKYDMLCLTDISAVSEFTVESEQNP